MSPAIIISALSLLTYVAADAAVSLDGKGEKSAAMESDPASKPDPAGVKGDSPMKTAMAAFESGEHEKAVGLAKPLAEKGDADAMYLLGFAHETGRGAESSREKAIENYRKSSAKGHSDAAYRLAFSLMGSDEEGAAAEARTLLEKEVEKDPAVAGRILGEAHLLGRFSKKPDPESAVSWWKKSSEAGDVPSMIFLARFYEGQMGFPEMVDPKQAFEYFQMAAKKGNPAAMVAVGSNLLSGDNVKRDEKLGMEWLNKAIEAKDYSAYLVKGMYQQNVKKDPKAALAEYERGRDAGQVDSMVRVAEFHMTGTGTEKDLPRGLKILETAAGAGSPQAHFMLAANILNEKEPDILKGYSHLVSAANGGLATAQNELGLFYLSNKLGAADVSAALSWFGRAAQANFAPAQNNLGALHERGAGVPKNFETAGQLYALAAQQGHPEATLALARLHATGAGTTMNRQRAWALATLAGERGEKNAAAIIAEIEKKFTPEDLTAAKKELGNLKAGKPAE